MKPKMDEKQLRALECLDRLTAYASENKVPMRIIDELEECKKQIASANADWSAIHLTMEDLLKSIERKVSPQIVREVHDDNEISIEMIKEQLEKMAGRCRADNRTSIDSMAERKNTLVKMNCEQLMDISHTKAHFEELKNEDLYLLFFQQCRSRYESGAFEMFRELLRSISENYNHMLNHMKSMFQSIDGYKNGICSEKFYYEYEERRTGIDHRVQGEMQTADIGGGDILSFAQTTKEKIKKIANKLTCKRKLLAWAPVLVALGLLVIGVGGTIIANQKEAQQAEADAEAQEDSDASRGLANAVNNIVQALDKVSAKRASQASGFMWKGILIGAAIVIALYAIYIQILKKWCNHQICRQCGEYLKTELLRFEQTNELLSKLDAAMQNAAEEYERQYMDVLNNLLQNSQYQTADAAQTGTMSKFDLLRDEWNCVRNM